MNNYQEDQRRQNEDNEDQNEVNQEDQDDDEDKCHQYRGESSKSAFVRNRGHWDKLKGKQGSFMHDHIKERHPEVNTLGESKEMFKMDVTNTDTEDPMRRIIREAVKIKSVIDGEKKNINVDENKTVEKDIILTNTKREFFLPTLNSGKMTNIRAML